MADLGYAVISKDFFLDIEVIPLEPDMRSISIPSSVLRTLTDEEYLCLFEQMTGLSCRDQHGEVIDPEVACADTVDIRPPVIRLPTAA